MGTLLTCLYIYHSRVCEQVSHCVLDGADLASAQHLVPNLGEHGCESTGNTLVPFYVYVRFMLTLHVLQVEWSVDNSTWDAIGEPQNSPGDKVVDIE